MGISWANCVNSRLFLSMTEEVGGQETSLIHSGSSDSVNRRTKRHLHVASASNLPDSSCEFVVAREEIFGVER